ncbi:MAG: S8 family serine peptidase, partial [Candidatus Omnitrophica bacterium]|nr:S8 family serine peptidase [Candidatus Omnitrophota bacterium]
MKASNLKTIILCTAVTVAALILLSQDAGLTEDKPWYWFMQSTGDVVANTQSDNKPNSDVNTQSVIISGHTISAPAAAVSLIPANSPAVSQSKENTIETPKQIQPQSRYVPNEIIVKFKADAADTLEREIIRGGEITSPVQISPSIDKLNEKHKVKKINPVFKNFKKDKERIKLLGQKEVLRKHFQETYSLETVTLTEKEKHLLKRLESAPKYAKIPDLDRIYKLELKESQSVEETVAEYNKDPNVEYAEPNYIVYAYSFPEDPPNDPYYASAASWGQGYDDLWGIKKIQCEAAWDITIGEGVVVAVIDSGVDYTHPDLAGNIWINAAEIPDDGIDNDGNGYIDDYYGFDFANSIDSNEDNDYNDPEDTNDHDPMDGAGHGTHCAGTIAAVGNNDLGVIGVAPGAKIMAVKGLSDSGSGSTSNLAKAIYYAANNGADILSNSWGGFGFSSTLETVFVYAHGEGCVSIAAAGNDSFDVSYATPANIDCVI